MKRFLDDLRLDLRFALRYYARAPYITAIMMVTLALGVTANASLFGVTRFALNRPVPGVPVDERLVRVRDLTIASFRGYRPGGLTAAALREQTTHPGFAALAAETGAWAMVDLPSDGPAQLRAGFVSPGYFTVLGVRVALGPGLPTTSDTSAPPELIAVVSHRLWSRSLGADTLITGRRLLVNDAVVTVAGVAPPEFKGIAGDNVDVWIPAPARRVIVAERDLRRDSTSYAVARLAAGMTIDRASSIAAALAQRQAPANGRGAAADVAPLRANNTSVDGGRRFMILTAQLSVITILILLITCTNVSSLLVGRAVTRGREIAARLALGAPRRRILKQLLTENLLLAAGAGVLTIMFLYIAGGITHHYIPNEVPASPDPATMAFAVGFAVLTVLVFGLSPALHATRAGVAEVLKDSASLSSRRRSRLQSVFVVAQVALTQPLLVGLVATMVLFVQEHRRNAASDIETHLAEVSYTRSRSDSTDEVAAMRRLTDRVNTMPGVVAAARDVGFGFPRRYRVDDRDKARGASVDPIHLSVRRVSREHFAVRDHRLVRGRLFDATDVVGAPRAVIVHADLARQLWGDADPIGRRLAPLDSSVAALTVIGIVDGTATQMTSSGDRPQVYASLDQEPRSSDARLIVRTRGPAVAALPTLRAAAREVAPEYQVTVQSLAERSKGMRDEALRLSSAAGAAGLVALLLASIGLYAVIASGIGLRVREIGLRMALGAHQAAVVGLFFRQGMRLCAIGLAIGLPLSGAALIALTSSGGDVGMNTTMVVTAVGALMIAVSAIAIWLPARTAARVDPLIALRSE